MFLIARDRLELDVRWVHARVLRKLFAPRASVRNCDGSCCRSGTTVSILERDRILEHQKIVREAMTTNARREPSLWFGRSVARDPDFAQGRSTSTRVEEGACVFFRRDRLCALQVAGERSRLGAYALKPAVCVLWPLCVEDRTLDVGYAWFTRRRACCAPVRRGVRSILEVVGPDAALISRIPLRRASGGPGTLGRL